MTGLASLLVVAVISGLAAVTFWFPQKEKSQNYYLTKDLINCSVLFVAIPLVVVKNNDAGAKHRQLCNEEIRLLTHLENTNHSWGAYSEYA